ncbi:hypothetical protein BKK79_26875 [Cupriavidus sp. USMAA2-4]|uniref:Tripartite tricarboxylate transporter substrate binding protein n=1 Tax=Cupriavidus malaysiensis TaxID=367825 RepID=A0ABM6FA46_9BURK|nr:MULTISPECIES: tripartite tricarboxylate transporter substrate binding protein [Cupriavidus]AOY95394.1 hypothetical protein BKK79_26875 [Cupriavidus sp. USMAA2-4]AOZ01685.1 hypothetical protein BKK81_20095 [Cupriavidus sp. USMAHM13]AOZ08565.1 hypothetical protein BKK80_21710 [Cupriavidus malaysiensis]
MLNPFLRSGLLRACLLLFLAATFGACPVVARAEDFPARPITIVVPFTAGGAADVGARRIAEKVTEYTGQPVLVDNRPGGGGQIGASAVKNARPDGYVLYLASVGSHAINSSLYTKLSYDPVKDFAPVAPLFSFPHVLVVPPSSPARSPADLAALSKGRPGGLSYASMGIGSGGHLLAEMFRSRTRLEATHVPYKGSSQAVADAVAGRFDFFFNGIVDSLPLVREGKVRALAIADTQRSPLLPNLPTMIELGYPDFVLNAWFGVVAPAGTPKAVVAKLNAEFAKAARDPEVVAKMAEQGAKMMTGTPEEFASLMRSETIRLGKVVRESGAHLD